MKARCSPVLVLAQRLEQLEARVDETCSAQGLGSGFCPDRMTSDRRGPGASPRSRPFGHGLALAPPRRGVQRGLTAGTNRRPPDSQSRSCVTSRPTAIGRPVCSRRSATSTPRSWPGRPRHRPCSRWPSWTRPARHRRSSRVQLLRWPEGNGGLRVQRPRRRPGLSAGEASGLAREIARGRRDEQAIAADPVALLGLIRLVVLRSSS